MQKDIAMESFYSCANKDNIEGNENQIEQLNRKVNLASPGNYL